jgi:hypothetical protein
MNLPPEYDAVYISGLEEMMLAQAQEAAWQLVGSFPLLIFKPHYLR